jgi:hypothetical protein
MLRCFVNKGLMQMEVVLNRATDKLSSCNPAESPKIVCDFRVAACSTR